MNRRRLLGMLLVPAMAAMAACASTGGPTTATSTTHPETRALQHVEVDGSVRVRANRHRR